MRTTVRVPALAIVLAAAALQAGAQTPLKSSFDRTVQPTAGADPTLTMPKWTKSTLSNGAQLIVIERHQLPMISMTINFVGGSNQFEPVGKAGVGTFTAGMMSEGTTKRSADDISNALQLLGTGVGFGIGAEGGSVSFRSITSKFAPTLDILMEEMLQPAFPAPALERLRARTIVTLKQNKDRGPTIASLVYPKLLYGADHPYGRTTTEESAAAITRDDIVAFHKAFYQPARATVTIVGDITPADAKAKIEKAFTAWPAGGTVATFAYPTPPAQKTTTIYLVDKPNAAQSSFAIGLVGPPRNTPDYPALRVLNAMFGSELGVATRLNLNIREQKGYSYGVNSQFGFGRGPGPIRIFGDIQTDKTDSALVEFIKEIKGIRGDKPASADELKAAKSAIVQSLPARTGSLAGVASLVNEIYLLGLPEDYWSQYTRSVNAVTAQDLQRVAQKYVDIDHLNILVVGDRTKIEAGLKALGIAPVVVVDINGREIIRP